MRNALKSAGSFAARILPLLLMLALAGVTNASAAAEGAGGYMGTAPGTVAALGLGAIALGTVVHLSGTNEDGEEESVMLDTENDDSQGLLKKLKRAAKLKAQAIIGPAKEKLEAAQAENETFRDIIVGEVLRIKKLTAGQDGEGNYDFDVEQEKQYLEGLPADRLKMEYERLPNSEDVKVEQTTTEGEKQGEEDDELQKLRPDTSQDA